MRIEFTVRDGHGLCRDLSVTAPAGSALCDVDAVLADVLGCERAVELWSGARRLAATALLGSRGLRTGDLVTVGEPGAHDPSAGAVLRLHVVGGPDAGRVVALPRGMLTLGRAVDCGLVLTDPDVSRRHACLTVTAGGVTVHDLESSNGTTIDGVPVDEDGSALAPGEVLRAGDSFLTIRCLDEPMAELRTTLTGALLVNRPPRPSVPVAHREIEFPTRGDGKPAQRVQWIAALLPALAGVGLAVALHSAQFLAFALLSPMIVLATWLGDRLHWRRSRRREAMSWRHREASASAEATAAVAHEIGLRRKAHPDPTLLQHIAAAPGTRLWERRRPDPDTLTVRLGLTELTSAVHVRRGATSSAAGRLRDVPVSVDLRRGPLGIAAPAGIGLGIVRWLLCQLAVLHSPVDVEFALLLAPEADAPWAWARWFPHLKRPPARTPEQRLALLAELTTVIEQRHGGRRDPAPWTGPWTVLIIDRAAAFTDLPGLGALLATGPTVGITALCVDIHRRQLPSGCVTSAVVAGETGSCLEISRPGSTEAVLAVADRVTGQWAESVARALAPLQDSEGGVGSGLTQQCRLLELLDIEDLDAASLRDRWTTHDGCAGTVLGAGVDGPVRIDLVHDGPHALVAGTTGSGKSELLQSLVAGLAVNYPPDAVSFLLIDYKGGAAFADCARLPHTVGLVTDLDAQLTERALRSLRSELSRRESMFAAEGVVDLNGYRVAALHSDTLARLVLVVDEFAALAEELPDFVSGLIAIAQRGRSLGVHLVLATQRPGGVVSPEIRANTTLRVALRMSDPAESCDVIGTDRAAQLGRDTPGRAIVRTAMTLTDLQTARVGGPAGNRSKQEVAVTPLGPWRTPVGPAAVEAGTDTDLHLLVDALRVAATGAGVQLPPRPWLPPLSQELSSTALPGAMGDPSITFGLVDRPERQRQTPLAVDLAAGGSVLFTGGLRSGRSTALLTIALVAAQQLSCADLAIYAIDCAGGGLGPVTDLPHCGTAVGRESFELVEMLLHRLEAAVHQRQSWLAELGVSSVRDARGDGHEVPLMLCLLDGWDSFVALAEERDGGRSTDILVRLLRECASVGLTVVIAGDRATLSARMAAAVAERFVLRLTERLDYGLAGIPVPRVPRAMPPGRAIRAADAAEVQVAFVGAAPTRAELRRVVAAIRDREPGNMPDDSSAFAPIRLRPLPSRVALSQLPVTAGRFTVGLAGDRAEPLSIDLFAGAARLLVVGPPRSGRSSVLHALLVQGLRDGVAVVLAARHRTLLARAAEAYGIRVLGPDAPATGAGVSGQTRTLLLVDDSEAFVDTPVGGALTIAVRSAPAGLAAVVAANSDDVPLTFRGVAAEVRRSRCALVLQPGSSDADLVGRRLPPRRGAQLPGRGLLVADPAWGDSLAAEPLPLQMALP